MARVSQNLIGERVKKARAAANPPLTQGELSKKLGKLGVSIDRAGIAKIETGIRGVLDFELVALSKALNVTIQWLLNVTEQKNKHAINDY
jgi:HTH-type transcriptional regulator, cell division transcriptional repressor